MAVITEAHKTDMFAELINSIDQKFGGSSETSSDLGQWAVNNEIMLDGKKFTFKKHEYLIEPYSDKHPYQVEIKATQLGLTSKAMLRVFHTARYGGDSYRGIGYYFPSRTDVTDLSKTRIDPLIDDNPETIGQWMRDTNAANVKKIWNTNLYLRGMRSRVGAKSSPMDFVVFDELDEAPPKMVDMILERMAHSEEGELLYLSNPTLPDYGIDRLFQLSNQMYWLIKCPKCNHYTDLVGTFPECLLMARGRVIRACEKCHAELDPSKGAWFAKRPDITDIHGRQFSQLYSQTKMTNPEKILHTFQTTNNLTDFYNLKLGIAYVEAQNRLSVQQVLDCCGDRGIASSCDEGTFMGVDQGNNLHVVIGKPHPKRAGEVIHIGEYLGNKGKEGGSWKQLDELMARFKVMRCVVDGLPETKHARAFAERFPGRVFLLFANVHQKGSYRWDERAHLVSANITETLDASHRLIADCDIILPRKSSDVVQEFARHCHAVAKKLEEDDETGSSRYVYIHRLAGPDHYVMAFDYMVMCLLDAPALMFPELL
ncbi:MAG: Bacteriophage tail assembly protein [Parcubacteria group bacterium GW2011_GWF1_40_6]|nr:MAG: Bacteriophage tail assembly protein [Parcubacteria group bacterium GW2011_GWF1_40_6]